MIEDYSVNESAWLSDGAKETRPTLVIGFGTTWARSCKAPRKLPTSKVVISITVSVHLSFPLPSIFTFSLFTPPPGKCSMCTSCERAGKRQTQWKWNDPDTPTATAFLPFSARRPLWSRLTIKLSIDVAQFQPSIHSASIVLRVLCAHVRSTSCSKQFAGPKMANCECYAHKFPKAFVSLPDHLQDYCVFAQEMLETRNNYVKIEAQSTKTFGDIGTAIKKQQET